MNHSCCIFSLTLPLYNHAIISILADSSVTFASKTKLLSTFDIKRIQKNKNGMEEEGREGEREKIKRLHFAHDYLCSQMSNKINIYTQNYVHIKLKQMFIPLRTNKIIQT